MRYCILLLLIFITLFIQNSFTQNISAPNQYSNDSLILKAKKLKQLYLKSTSSPSDLVNIYKKKFFDEFPSTFKQLDELYGNDSDINHKPALLYDQAQQHIINLFNELNTINDTLYYRKIVSVAIDGHWDGDAVNFFQHGLRNKVLNNPALIVHVLKGMSNGRIQSFWYFYFDGAHPKKQIAEPLQKIRFINNKIYDLMIKAQTDVLKHSKE